MNPTPLQQATVRSSLVTRLLDGLRRLGERRQLRQMMARRSDRLLADIGLSREQLSEEIEATVGALQQRREIERRVRGELEGHSDRELQDIGIRRDEIRGLAREHAQQAIALNRFGNLDVAGQPRTNDNAETGRRPDVSDRAA